MKFLKTFLICLALLPLAVYPQSESIHHNLQVSIQPAESAIRVSDELTMPGSLLTGELKFTLNAALRLISYSGPVHIEKTGRKLTAADLGMDREQTAGPFSRLKLTEYRVKVTAGPEKELRFRIEYGGKIASPVEQSAENYQRGFSQSPGIIVEKGIYLAGSTYWTPTFGEQLATFELTTKLPAGWMSVSQGKRTESVTADGFHTDRWTAAAPQEEIFLIAAKFHEYDYSAGAVKAMAFLRTPDEGLANKYLETTAQYLEMYRRLLGPYPYPKFALVENFWETGYGMPSFTLLGEKIIRFPFILHSSYPHELLHNYWGNGVYVDFSHGNWCEGLTAYMADHLIKEQRGQGAQYRRSTLQRFTNYVNKANDFPLNKFRNRYDAPSEAIGYGKTLMMWHMLRQKTGDEEFVRAFRLFYRQNKFQRASFDDIRAAFEKVTGKDLTGFFHQWVNRTGAPELKITAAKVVPAADKFRLEFTLKQTQDGAPFQLDVPVVVTGAGGSAEKRFAMIQKTGTFEFELSERPLRLDVDPQFDLFRRLDANEIPPSLSRAYGAEKSLFILPAATDPEYAGLKKFAEGWREGHREEIKITGDDQIAELPNDRAVWILGYGNKFLPVIRRGMQTYRSDITADTVQLDQNRLARSNNSFIITLKNRKNVRQAVVWFSLGNEKAVPGLNRKLPHYGKYSFLAFEGDEPANIAKGQWAVVNSPLTRTFASNGRTVPLKLPGRKALAYLKPVFSAKRMMKHVNFLASDELKGRGLGTPELDKAADYIAAEFKRSGLLPGGEDGSYFQTWQASVPGKGGRLTLKNVLGIIPGNDPHLSAQAVVISAHYDHLGLGWPDVHKGDAGKIHHGADDNASGVAVVLELARTLGKSFKPARTVIFAAFTGEEAGLLGSRYFVKHYQEFPADKICADLNLDTVGRLFGHKLLVLNGASAREWKFIFMGTEYVTGVPSEMVTQRLDASDQVSFIRGGIPAVQLFSGPNADYHRPTDTADKIDPDGLVKVATVAKETLDYLASRKEPLSFAGNRAESGAGKAPRTAGEGRRVSTGSIPDFTFSGNGVKLGGVEPNSPAAAAGLRKGDILLKFNGKPIADLQDYSNYLKKQKAGDLVEITFARAGKVHTVKLKLAER